MLDRYALVCAKGTSDEVLIEIANKETDLAVKHGLAKRSENPMQVWEKLAGDKDSRVWDFLRENKNTPKEILDKLPKEKVPPRKLYTSKLV